MSREVKVGARRTDFLGLTNSTAANTSFGLRGRSKLLRAVALAMAVQAGCAREDGAGAGERGCVSSERSETQSCRWLLLGRQRPHYHRRPLSARAALIGPADNDESRRRATSRLTASAHASAVLSLKPHVAPSPWHVFQVRPRRVLGTLLTSPPGADAVHVAGQRRRERCLAAPGPAAVLPAWHRSLERRSTSLCTTSTQPDEQH